MKKDYSEILRRLECGPFDGVTRDAAYMAIKELVAERDARAASDAGNADVCACAPSPAPVIDAPGPSSTAYDESGYAKEAK